MSTLSSPVWSGVLCPVTQPYGCTTVPVEPVDPSCPGGHFHCGIDIGMNIGTPLYAARTGIVIYVGYGLLCIQANVNDQHDWYVHIDRVANGISAFDGTLVKQGQLVAYSGDKTPSGGVTYGPHLHFEVQTGALNVIASSLNPVPVLEGEGVETMDLFLIGPLPEGAVYVVGPAGKRHIGPDENAMYVAKGLKPQPATQAQLDEIPDVIDGTVFPTNLIFSGSVTGTGSLK